MKNPYLLLGTVVKPQGTRGEVRVKPCTDDPGRFLSLDEVSIRDGSSMTPRKVESARVAGEMVCLRLEGVNDRAAAEAWRDTELYVRRDQAVPLEEGRFFIADLIGCRVQDESGAVIGLLSDVLQPGGHDVYVVRADHEEILLPAVRALITAVDPEAGVVTVNRERFGQMAVRNPR